ncbi:MAG: MgtC/SapB family protein [Candidatus Thorarchaeota archaeon]
MQAAIEFLSADLIIRSLMGFAVGALIGLERQKKEAHDTTAGVRSFGLHSLLGALAAYSFLVTGNPIILVYATAISIILVSVQVYHKIIRSMRKGMTTSIVFAMSFVLGTLVGLDVPPEGQLIGSLQVLAMTISFMVFLILGFKEELANAVRIITRDEMTSAVELGVIILFIWPLLPLTIQIFNITFPVFQTYLLIVLLLTISFANYILVKKYQHRGIYFLGFFGGFANSEATTSSLTDFYVKTERKNPGRISLSVILANLAMVLRNGVLILLLDTSFQIFKFYLFPLVLLFIVGVVRMIYEQRKTENSEEVQFETTLGSPFEIGAALRFGAIFAVISLISLFAQELAGDAGFIVAAALGGIVSAGAITAIAASSFAGGVIPLATAVYAVIIASTFSVLNKLIYVYIGDREIKLTKIVAKDSLIMAACVVIYILLLITGAISFI